MASTSARERWRAARSLAELCALGGEFVAGRLEAFPGWGAAALDTESDPLAPVLERLNRAGLWTLCSQPGACSADHAIARRAFVCGFASEPVAAALRGPLPAGIEARVLRADDPAAEPVPVTIEHGAVRVAIGGPAHAAEAECCADWLAPELAAELARWPYVCAWQREFGPADDFWRELCGRLEACPR